jgi:serine/threonine protein kinase
MKNKKGGKPIGSGGYGCVFKPALKCSNPSKTPLEGNIISKLMFTERAQEEYDDSTKFSSLLKKIPNYKSYFLVDDIEYCSPGIIPDSELTNFNKTCESFLKKKKTTITDKNINSNLDKFKLLNMVYGGEDLDKYFKVKITDERLNTVINGMIDLLQHAIVPMNKLHLFHLDLKSANILINKKNQMKIIDWGLAGIFNGKKIPENLINRPFQYNFPFNSILINNKFTKDYNQFLKLGQIDLVDEFVKNYILSWSKIRGDGHKQHICNLIKLVYQYDIKKQNISCNELLHSFIETTLLTFTEGPIMKQQFNMFKFLNVLTHNADIWGLLMCLEPLFFYEENLPDHLQFKNKQEIMQKIAMILIRYCFDNPVLKIKPTDVIKDLKAIQSQLDVKKGGKKRKTLKKKKKRKRTRKKMRGRGQGSPKPVINITDDEEFKNEVSYTCKGKQIKEGFNIRSLIYDESSNTYKYAIKKEGEYENEEDQYDIVLLDDFKFNKIAQGTYGSIIRATSTKYPEVDFIIKESLDKSKPLDEIRLLNEYPFYVRCKKHIIPFKKHGNNRVIMPYVSGDLFELKDLDITQIKRIISILGESLLCLSRDGIFYFDIKAQNILYNCSKNGSINVFLGDLGSALPDNEGDYRSTFPPPCMLKKDSSRIKGLTDILNEIKESDYTPEKENRAKELIKLIDAYKAYRGIINVSESKHFEKIYSWQLAVLAFELLQVPKIALQHFSWSGFINLEILQKIIDSLEAHNNFGLGPDVDTEFLRRSLIINPKDRISLSKMLELL